MSARVLVIGAGRMGRAIAWDLARQKGIAKVRLADKAPMAGVLRADAARPASLLPLLSDCDAAVSAVPYFLNLGLAKAALKAGCSFSDLGGNDAVVRAELSLDREARKKGITIVPDTGLAPGMVSLLAAHAISEIGKARAVRIRVGGIPLHPKPPLGYALVFSPEGLINEYVEPCRALRKGRISVLPPLSELEALRFPGPFGTLEAFTTSGGASTLPDTYRGKVKDLDYKTIRWPGHAEQVRLLMALGLTEKGPARDLLIRCLERSLPPPGRDAVLIRVTAEGSRGTLVLQAVELGGPRFSAMMRCTALPAAIIAGMLARREIRQAGALPQERCVPAGVFLQELSRRGIRVRSRWS